MVSLNKIVKGVHLKTDLHFFIWVGLFAIEMIYSFHLNVLVLWVYTGYVQGHDTFLLCVLQSDFSISVKVNISFIFAEPSVGSGFFFFVWILNSSVVCVLSFYFSFVFIDKH